MDGQLPTQAHVQPCRKLRLLQIDKKNGLFQIAGEIQLVTAISGGNIGGGDQGHKIAATFDVAGDVFFPVDAGSDTLVVPDTKTGSVQPADHIRRILCVEMGIA